MMLCTLGILILIISEMKQELDDGCIMMEPIIIMCNLVSLFSLFALILIYVTFKVFFIGSICPSMDSN